MGYYLKVRDWLGVYVSLCTVKLMNWCVHKHSAGILLLFLFLL